MKLAWCTCAALVAQRQRSYHATTASWLRTPARPKLTLESVRSLHPQYWLSVPTHC